MTGTALAQALPIAISPILTRLYSPAEFGLAALYLSCMAVLTLIATGRYELAITLPVTDEEAALIVTFTLKLAFFISVLLYFPIIFFGDILATWLGNADLKPWFYLLPVSVLTTAGFNILQYWCNRKSLYRTMSTNRVQNSFLSSLFNVVLGLSKTPGGMILGPALGQALAAGIIGRKVWKENHSLLSATSMKGEQTMAMRYIDHPKHIAPAQLLGTIAIQIPIFMIGSVYSLAVLGFFSLAYRMVTLPTSLVASAIGDVYRQKSAEAYNNQGDFYLIYVKTLRRTIQLAIPPFIAAYFLAPTIFEWVYGLEWRIAGVYAQILVVGAFFQFIFTPVQAGAVLVGATRYILFWQSTRLLLMLCLYYFLSNSNTNIIFALWCFVIINTFLYILDIYMEYKFSKKKKILFNI